MIPRALLLAVLLAGCEKASSRPADQAASEPTPSPPDARPVDGLRTTTIEVPRKQEVVDDQPPKMVVAIDRSGRIHVGGRPAGTLAGPLDELEQRIADLVGSGFDEVYLEVDQDLPYSAIYPVMQAIKEAGMTRVMFVVDR